MICSLPRSGLHCIFRSNYSPLKKTIFRVSVALLFLLIGYAIFYGWRSFPIIAGFGAKDLCSCMFVSGRSEADVKQQELRDFPFSLANYKVNWNDSTVTGTVWGMAKRKAVFRRGLGCTLVNGITETQLKQQSFGLAPLPTGNPDSIPWPDGDLLPDSFPTEVNRSMLEKAVANAFAEPDPKKERRTRAVVVVYNGKLVAERYAPGYNQHSLMHGWSVAKSFVSSFVGILVREGKLNIKSPAPIDAWKSDARRTITVEQLLQQTSGLDFSEDYSGYSEVTNMLFNKGDMAGYAASRPLKHTPGTVFNYSSGNSNILSQIVRQTTGNQEYYRFPARQLFQKIGMRSTLIEPDASGTMVASSYVFATARDYARFGLLYCNGGKWKDEQILPEGWVEQTMRPAATNALRNYGYQFWLKGRNKHPPHMANFPDVPNDLFYADGYAYQEIYIIPSKKLVVVRLGLTLDGSFDENAFLRDILRSLD